MPARYRAGLGIAFKDACKKSGKSAGCALRLAGFEDNLTHSAEHIDSCGQGTASDEIAATLKSGYYIFVSYNRTRN